MNIFFNVFSPFDWYVSLSSCFDSSDCSDRDRGDPGGLEGGLELLEGLDSLGFNNELSANSRLGLFVRFDVLDAAVPNRKLEIKIEAKIVNNRASPMAAAVVIVGMIPEPIGIMVNAPPVIED